MAQNVIAIVIIIAPSLASIVDRFKRHGYWGILASVALLVAATFIACYRLQKQVDNIRDGIPRLICRGHSEYVWPIQDGTGNVIGIPTFYHLKIVNDPRGVADRKTAKQVVGTVEILYQDRRQACASKQHRWEHSRETAQVGREANLLGSQDIPPNGAEVLLDIAMKYDDEDDFYTPTNDTDMRPYPGRRDVRYKFTPGEYIARIRLAGANVDTKLECKIVNGGKGKKLELIPQPEIS